MQISKGRIQKPLKVVIYGPEGIGKSTLASQFPNPVFIDTEGSTNHMDVARLPAPSSWAQLIEEVQYVKSNPDVCRTLVIDTADWAEKLCTEDVCAKKKVDGIEGIGYGKGYVYVKESFGGLLNQLNDLLDRGINVVITAHAQMRKFEQPDELGAYDRWEMKLSKQVGPLVKEWADMILFCNYKTMVVNVDGQGAQKGKNKVQGGRRIMYTTHHACWDAKNRFGLPDEVDMNYESIRSVVESSIAPTQNTPVQKSVPDVATNETEDNIPGQMSLFEKAASQDPVASARRMTPEAARKELGGSGTMSPPPDEDPEVPAKSPTEKTEPETGGSRSAVSRYFSDPGKLPKALTDLMEQDNICEWSIQAAVASKGYYPSETLIQNMDPEFINGWIVGYWPKVKELIREIQDKEEVPFN